MGGTEDGQEKFAREHGKNIASCADNPGSASCQKGLAMQDALTVALPAGLGGGILAAATPEIAAQPKPRYKPVREMWCFALTMLAFRCRKP